jgi:hypothetical protein
MLEINETVTAKTKIVKFKGVKIRILYSHNTVKSLKLDTLISWTPLYVEYISFEPLKMYFYMSIILFILDTPLSWNSDIPFVISWTGYFSQL